MISLLLVVALATAGYCDNRIVGGTDVTEISQVPYQVSLQNNAFHFCGGSLIHEQFVMSAAHCWSRDLTGYTVNIGAVNNRESPFVVPMDQWIRHDQFSLLTIDYDYSIIKLAYPVPLSADVATIKIATKEYPAGTLGTISGWGLMQGSDATTPIIMQVAQAPFVDKQPCQDAWRSLQTITDRMQCVGGGNTSGCKGDSGGPVAVHDPEEGWVLVGNTSFGHPTCKLNSIPAVWSKNSYPGIKEWIDLTIANL